MEEVTEVLLTISGILPGVQNVSMPHLIDELRRNEVLVWIALVEGEKSSIFLISFLYPLRSPEVGILALQLGKDTREVETRQN